MTTEQMLYEFELSADKVNSRNAMNLSLPAKLAYLNRGQLSLILNRYDGVNATRRGFEDTRKRTEDLQVLVVPEEKLSVEKEVESKGHAIYIVDLTKTQHKYLILLRQYGTGSKGDCKGQRIKLKDTQIDDLEAALSDPFRKPDFRWREALLITAQDKLWIYTDGFRMDSVGISYLRYPRNIDMKGYITFANTESDDVSCELPDYLHDAIVQEAVCNLKADLGDPAYQTAAYKVMKTE